MVPAPCNLCRRDFLAASGAGFGALAFGAMSLLEARRAAAAPKIDPLRPFAPRVADFKPRAKSVIFLFMVGGPSQVDTFDYKPELQKLGGKPVPQSFRKALETTRHANVFHGCKDELLASPFKFAQH